MKYTMYALLAGTFLVGACESTVEVDLPDKEPRLVVNSFFATGNPWEVHLSESRPIGTFYESIPNVTGATVEISGPGSSETVRLLHTGEGVYKALSALPGDGKTYTLRASAEGYASVQAEDAVPEQVPVHFSHTIGLDSSTDISDDAVAHVTIVLEDPPDAQDYYRLYVQLHFPSAEVEPHVQWFQVEDEAILAENDPVISEPDALVGIGDESGRLLNAVFSDVLFNGKRREFTITVQDVHPVLCEVFDDMGSPAPGSCTLRVYFEHISEAFYKYATTVRLHDELGNNPFGEPVRVFTNVENGFGVFAGYQSFEQHIALDSLRTGGG